MLARNASFLCTLLWTLVVVLVPMETFLHYSSLYQWLKKSMHIRPLQESSALLCEYSLYFLSLQSW